MNESRVLFRRRAAVSGLISLLIFVFVIIVLRQSYNAQITAVVRAYNTEQSAIAERAGVQARDELLMLGGSMRVLAGALPDTCFERAGACDTTLAAHKKRLAGHGLLDIIFIHKTGEITAKSMDKDFFEQSGFTGWPAQAAAARKTALSAETSEAFVSQVFPYKDSGDRDRPAVLITVPVFRMVRPAPQPPAPGEDAAAPARPARRELAGIIAAPVGLMDLSAMLQQWGPERGARRLMILTQLSGPVTGNIIISHPDPEFIGASATEALALTNYNELDAVIKNMLAGRRGFAPFLSPSDRRARGNDKPDDIRWWMAYTAAGTPAGRWAVGIATPHAEIPLIGSFVWKYFSVALALFLLLAAANLLPLFEYRRLLAVKEQLLHMHDISAINEILRNVNEELTEGKRVLEARAGEVGALHDQNEELLEKVALEQLELFGAIKNPTPEQRRLMLSLKRDLETLRKKPEGHFWKRGLDAPDKDAGAL